MKTHLYCTNTVPTSTVRWQNLVVFCHTIPSNESSHAIFLMQLMQILSNARLSYAERFKMPKCQAF